MQSDAYSPMMWRTFLVALFIAVISLSGNFILVEALRLTGERVSFSSQWALILFGIFVGMIPFRPAGSRISNAPIGFFGRIILLVECTLFVVVATYVSSFYISHNNLVVGYDLWVGEAAYTIVLVVMLLSNFSRLKAEVRIAKE
jgi:hypothetical protein